MAILPLRQAATIQELFKWDLCKAAWLESSLSILKISFSCFFTGEVYVVKSVQGRISLKLMSFGVNISLEGNGLKEATLV